jgi:Cu+-exporting ATPase
MKRHFAFTRAVAGLLAVIAALLSATVSHAQPREARSALIIGISQYGTPGAETLEGVRHDVTSAQRIAEAMGIPALRTVVLRDGQATRDGILRALDQLAAGAAPGGRVLIYYSGHGARVFDATLGGCREALLAYDGQLVSHEDIARRTRRIMLQNLGWAFGYNLIMLPLAAGALSSLGVALSPILASVAMSLSSVTVVANSLRLSRFKMTP